MNETTTFQWGSREISICAGNSQVNIEASSGEKQTFSVGDIAVYDIFNLVYTGIIKKITPKTVVIEKPYKNSRNVVMNHQKFASFNWDFDIERIRKENYEASMNF